MDDISLDERFTRLEAAAAGTFRPAPISAVLAAARRRRRSRRFTLAAVCALLVAAPVGGFAIAGGQPHPAPRPSVVVSPSPAGAVIERKPTLPGVDLPLYFTWFTRDGDHAWALFKSCPGGYGTCQYALGRTVDAGVTWQRVSLPNLAADAQVANFYPLDDETLTIYVLHKRFWLTVDGGRTYTQSPPDSPPDQALMAATYPAGDYTLLCPGAIGFEDGASGIECGREQLIRIGSGLVQPQPTLPGTLDQVIAGADGRIWLTSSDGPLYRIAVSDDGAKTWHQLPAMSEPVQLLVSPDGASVWAAATTSNRVWWTNGQLWTYEPDLPVHTGVAAATQGRLVLANATGPGGFWQGGMFTPMSFIAFGDDTVRVLPDGTVVFEGAGGSVVGTGSGPNPTWIHFAG